MSDISALTAEAGRLSAAVSWWNDVLIVMMVVAAIAATGLVIAQFITVKRTEQLAEVQERLGNAKEMRLAVELKEKDTQISQANARGEDAKREAALANERSAHLERETSALKAEAALANERIVEMKRMRRLDSDQAAALSILLHSELFQSKPQVLVKFAAVADAEAEMFAMEMQNFFASCGINTGQAAGKVPSGVIQLKPNVKGLIMQVKSKAKPAKAFFELQTLMASIGLPSDVVECAELKDDETIISVLRKPTPSIETSPNDMAPPQLKQ